MLFLGGVASNLGLLLEDEYDLFLEDPSYQKVSSARSSKKKLKQKEKI